MKRNKCGSEQRSYNASQKNTNRPTQRVTYTRWNLMKITYAAIGVVLILNTVMQERTCSSEKEEVDGTECDISRVAHQTFLRLQNSITT